MTQTTDWKLLKSSPRPVQLDALHKRRLSNRTHFAYFIEMQLGKTKLALADFADHAEHKLLVVCPPSFVNDWAAEIEAELGRSVFIINAKNVRSEWQGSSIVVAPRTAMQLPEWARLVAQYVDKRTFVIFDESAHYKNGSTNSFKHAYFIAERAGQVRLLTGLPAPQSNLDYWSQLKLINRMDINKFAFRARYCRMGGYLNKQIVGNVDTAGLLEKYINAAAFIATRKEYMTNYVAPQQQTLFAPIEHAKQKAAYKQIYEQLLLTLDDKPLLISNVLDQLSKLRQVSSGFVKFEGVDTALLSFEDTPKYKLLSDLLEADNGKVILLAWHRYTIANLVASFPDAAIIASMDYMYNAGRDVIAEKERFNNDASCRILIAQMDAVKFGHALVGTEQHPVSSVVFFEPNYSLETRSQCIARPSSVNRPYAVYDLAASAVEKKIIAAMANKEKLNQLDFIQELAKELSAETLND